ncbi:MAG: C-GCAxxG-C-C family protein [Bacteroidales bacterium]|jgi:C_GCAxxG_C_C family probable redox protein
MDKKKENALNHFRSGNNCAQSVLRAFSEELKVESNITQSIASGFGGGMGKLQETCGAVTGSFMVFGLYNGQKYPKNQEQVEITNHMIRDFNKRFTAIHGTIICKKLLNADLNTVEGQQYIKDSHLMESICEKCISDAVTIAKEVLG